MASNTRRVSLPPRGAWIEIKVKICLRQPSAGRSPHGERGLKFVSAPVQGVEQESLPPRGAWIEMQSVCGYTYAKVVAPPTGSVD